MRGLENDYELTIQEISLTLKAGISSIKNRPPKFHLWSINH